MRARRVVRRLHKEAIMKHIGSSGAVQAATALTLAADGM